MKPFYSIAPAQPKHLKALAGIELSAATLLQGYAPASVLAETTPEEEFRKAQEEGRLWVALADEIPVGFALVEMLDADRPHLQEMDVLPEHGCCGLGTALLQAVLEWTRRSGYAEITLTTFRTVSWNMPFYSQHGFKEIYADGLRADLKSIVLNEAKRGLDPKARVVMRYRVDAS
jgi:GNAT superfamily N-acetyltransferase